MVAFILTLMLMLPNPKAALRDTLEVEPEDLLGDASVDVEHEAALIQEYVQLAAASKLDLNRVEEADLLEIPGLSVSDADLILTYRASGKRIQTPDDLRAAGLSEDALRRLLPFIEFPRPRYDTRVEVVQRWTRRLDAARGFRGDSAAYLGDANALATRTRIAVGRRFRAAATFDKDPGEPLRFDLDRGALGYDFVAAYLAVEDLGPVREIIVGDYAVRVGEGLLLQQGASMGGVGVSPPRSGKLFRPYASAGESGFFRGVALRTREVFCTSLGVFVSHRRLDGRVDSTGRAVVVSTGLHRTASEREMRRMMLEEAAGVVLAFRSSRVNAGVAAYRHRLQSIARSHTAGDSAAATPPPVAPAPSTLLATGFLSARLGGILASAEAARRSASISTSITLEYEPVEHVSAWVRWRRTESTIERLHTGVGTFGSGLGRDESGHTAALRASPIPSVTLSLLSSYRTYSAVRQAFALTSSTSEAHLAYRPRKWFAFYLQARQKRYESSDVCLSPPSGVRCTETRQRRSLRLQVDYAHSERLRTRARIETVDVTALRSAAGGNQRGILMFEDIRWRPGRFVDVDFRLTYFDTEGFDARTYAVENDLLYSFSSPALIGRGRRAYVLLKLSPTASFSIHWKYAVTLYEDVKSIGSGRDEIEGSRSRDLKLQVRWVIK